MLLHGTHSRRSVSLSACLGVASISLVREARFHHHPTVRAGATGKMERAARTSAHVVAATAGPVVYLVTGASRGIGVEWVRQILSRGDSVIATCRNPSAATELTAVLDAHSGLGFALCLPLDVASEESVASLPAAIAATGKASSIDVLVHNAGISAPTHPVDPLEKASKQAMMDCFETNCAGPLLVTQALLPMLRAGSGKKVFFVSTAMASMGGAAAGSVSYRTSKAALNMLGRLVALEHGIGTEDGLAVTLCHPGWVDTDMGAAGDRSPPVRPVDSVAGMLSAVDSMGPHSTADFIDFEGNTLEW